MVQSIAKKMETKMGFQYFKFRIIWFQINLLVTYAASICFRCEFPVKLNLSTVSISSNCMVLRTVIIHTFRYLQYRRDQFHAVTVVPTLKLIMLKKKGNYHSPKNGKLFLQYFFGTPIPDRKSLCDQNINEH